MITTLLDYSGDGRGSLPNFLKELGFDDAFLRQYPISTLVEWGWLRPQYRVVFPCGYFTQGFEAQREFREQHGYLGALIDSVWDQRWVRLNTAQPFWFLHSFFRPGSELAEFLQDKSAEAGLPEIPDEFELPSGRKVRPYVDYFYPWQALALVDVVRAADRFASHILCTPDVTEQIAKLGGLASQFGTAHIKPHEYLDSENRWGGLAKLMTWLAHYQAMREHLNFFKTSSMPSDHHHNLTDGAVQLAEYLGINSKEIEALVKGHLLVSAQWWNWGKDGRRKLCESAYPHLQYQVYLALEWLCLLTGNTLDHYFDLWRYQFKGTQQWAELHKVLPFEYYSVREKFLELAPHYLSDFNQRLEPQFHLQGPTLAVRVDLIRSRSRHFNRLAMAFKKLHDELSGSRNDPTLIDFQDRDPLGHYLLVAIYAEKCFREELERLGKLTSIPLIDQGMKGYLKALGSLAGLHPPVIEIFEVNARKIGNLRQVPGNVIAQIKTFAANGIAQELPLVQAMICCEVARNYFAHHDYLDDKLLNDADSQFLLGGILVAVLVLLGT